jgi:hypothetical protein
MRFRTKEHWGPYLWGFIHSITIIDFENNEMYNNNVKNILKELRECLPCPKCKDTYKKYLDRLDGLDLTKSMVLFYWSVDLHNEVNKKLNKPEWSYEMALMKWTKKIDG